MADDILKKIKDPNYVRSVMDGGLEKSIEYGVKQNPGRHAEITKTAKQLDIPLDMAERQPEETKRLAREKDILKQIQNTEFVRRAMERPDFAAVAHEDVEGLVKTENAVKAIRGPDPSFGSITTGLLKALPQGVELARQGIRLQWADFIGSERMKKDALRKYEAAQTDVILSTPAFESRTASGAYSGGTSFMRQIPGFLASIATRSPTPMLATMGQTTEAEAYGKYRARGATPKEAFIGGMAEGATEVATELLPMKFLVDKLGKTGLSEFLTGMLAREIPGEQLATIIQDAVDTAIANPDKTWNDYLEERPGAAYETLVATVVQTGIMGGVHRVSQYADNAYKSEKSMDDHEALNNAVEAAKETKLRTQSPEVFKEFLDEALGADQNVFLAPEDAQVFFQSHPDLVDKLEQTSPDTAEAIAESLSMQTDVVIPKSDYLTYFTDFHEELSPVLRNDQDGLTAQEVEQFIDEGQDIFEKEATDMLLDQERQTNFEQSADQVKNDIKSQLINTGRFTPEVADQYAELHKAFAKVAAEKTGKTPYEAYFEIGPQVQGKPIAGEKLDQSDIFAGKDVAVTIYDEENGENLISFGKIVEPGSKESLVEFPDDTQRLIPNEQFSVSEGDKFFQKERGFYQPEQNIIGLLEDADLSTFLHESGHFFLETISRMPEFNQEMDATLKWFMLDRETWDQMSFEDKREYHEQFARGFEAYLLEGKAPSLELQTTFQRFRDWLINIYRSLRNLNVNLTKEVRQVFDRLLASEEQIREAEAARSYGPLFESFEDSGMTEKQWRTYQELDQERRQSAREELQTRSMKDMKWMANAKAKALRAIQKDVKAKRAAMREKIAEQVSQERVYSAIRFFRRGEYLDENGDVQTTEDHRLDIDILKAMYEGIITSPKDVVTPEVDNLLVAISKLGGLDKTEAEQQGVDPANWTGRNANTINQPVFGKRIFKDGGLSFDDMARQLSQYDYGVDTANDLLDLLDPALAGYPQYSSRVNYDLINQIYDYVDYRKLGHGKYGMLSKDGLDPEQSANMFGYTSADAMIRDMLEAPDQKEYTEAATDQAMLEEYGDISNPVEMERASEEAIHNDVHTRFLHTELKALSKGQGQKNILAKAAKDFANTAINNKKIRDIKPGQYLTAQNRAGNNAMRAIAKGDRESAVDHKRAQVLNNHFYRAANNAQKDVDKMVRYIRKFQKDGVRKKLDSEYLEQIDNLLTSFDYKNRSLKEIDKRQTLAEFIKQQEEENSFQPAIDPTLIEETKQKHYKNMTYSEFKGHVETIQQIEHLGRLKQKLLTAKDQREFNERMDGARRSIELLKNRKAPERATPNDVLGHVGLWSRQFTAMHRKFSSIIREMDGNKDGGIMWNLLLRTMNESGDNEIEMHAQATEALAELFEGLKIRSGRFRNPRYTIPNTDISLSDEERLMVALNWGNEGNRQRLLDGGLPGKKDLTQTDVQSILDTLSQQEWNFVQGVWDFLDGYRTQIGEQEKRLTGKTPKWVDPAPIETRFGTMKGGYFPAKYDVMLSEKAAEHEAITDIRMAMKGAFGAAATRSGFTKERADAVKDRPLLLNFDVITRHVNEVTHRLAWQDWITDAQRSLKALRPTIKEYYGHEIYQEMKDTVEDIAKGDTPAKNAFERAVNYMRVGATIVGMGWRVTTALIQPTGFAQSVYRVGRPWMARGIMKFTANPLKLNEEVNSRSKLMRDRDRTMQREINEVLTKVRGENQLNWVKSNAFWMMAKMQRAVDLPTWWGAYEKGLDQLQYETARDSSERQKIEEQAAAMADQAVIDSQSGGQLKDLAKIQRGSPLMKMFTNFYSYFSATYNLNVEAFRGADFSKPGEVTKYMGDVITINIIPVLLSVLIRESLKNDCDGDLECIGKKVATEQIDFMMGQMVPLREISSFPKALAGLETYPWYGPAGLRPIADVGKLGVQAAQGEWDRPYRKTLINVAGYLTHMPAGQINTIIDGFTAIENGDVEGGRTVLAPLAGPPRE